MTQNFFKQNLRKVGFAAWLTRLIPIPVGIITAKLMSKVVTKATGGNISGVLMDSAILLSVVIGAKLYEVITGIAYEKAASQAVQKCKILFYRKFLSFPLHVLYASEHGESIKKMNNDFKTVSDKSLTLYPEFWIGVITAAAYFVFLVPQSPFAALTLLVISLLQVIPPVIVKKYIQVNYDRTQKIEAQITNLIVEGYMGFATIKLYHLKAWYLNRIKSIHKRYLKIGNISSTVGTVEESMYALLKNLLKYGTYGIIGFFVLRKVASLEVGVQAIALSGDFFAAVRTVFSSIPKFAVAKTAEKRISRWLIDTSEADGKICGTDIVLSDVSFSYGGKTILENAAAWFDGSEICIVKGANGSGKSTLLCLITGLLQSNRGVIRIGGASPGNISEEEFRKKIFYLPQRDADLNITAYELYSMTVSEKVESAVQCACDFGLTRQIVKGSMIGELSGGQRKKVFLSLAFTLNPPILLLDEPTNSLDTDGKRILCEKLEARKSGAVIVTHDGIFNDIAQRVYTVGNGGVQSEKDQKNDLPGLRKSDGRSGGFLYR